MKKKYLLLSLLIFINTIANAQMGVFSWRYDTPAFPAPAMAIASGHTYIDIDPALTGNTVVSPFSGGSALGWQQSMGSPTYPAINGSVGTAANQCGASSDPNRLGLGVNFSSNNTATAYVTFTITFPTAVCGLNFKIYEIDKGILTTTGANANTYTFVDEVVISAINSSGTALALPSTTPSPSASTTASGTNMVITGTASDAGSSSGAATNIAYSSTDCVKTLTITYRSGTPTSGFPVRNDPTSQLVSIGCMSWSSPLPVTLTSFSSKSTEKTIKLNWTTASETNSSHFEVERSADVKFFERVATINSPRESSELQTYSFEDSQPIEGWNFYRLRQVDLDGTFSYSNIIHHLFQRNDDYM